MNKEEKSKKLNTFFTEVFNLINLLEERTLKESIYSNLSVREMHIIEAIDILSLENKNTMTLIADKLHITVGSLTTAIGVLVRKGYVERRRSDIDKRVIFIHLTEKGIGASETHKVFHEQMIENACKKLDDREMDSLVSALDNMSAFFGK